MFEAEIIKIEHFWRLFPKETIPIRDLRYNAQHRPIGMREYMNCSLARPVCLVLVE
jgi:hypothetical protein